MKKNLLILSAFILFLAVFASGCGKKETTDKQTEKQKTDQTQTKTDNSKMVADGKYFCPMHPTQQSDNPDAPCPICKMRLESKAEYNKKMDAEHEALENKYAGKTGLIHFEVKLSPVKSDECQPVIEKALSSDKGVVEYHIDIVNKVIHMYIDKNKTTKAAVEKAIADAGFDANDTKAGPDAVAKLPPDCR